MVVLKRVFPFVLLAFGAGMLVVHGMNPLYLPVKAVTAIVWGALLALGAGRALAGRHGFRGAAGGGEGGRLRVAG